ncbi:MAG: hypothetical protein EBS05_21850 [Proteobacteria bacterium]|nr:hypothetical protein [Pseudomonadota bacterium]
MTIIELKLVDRSMMPLAGPQLIPIARNVVAAAFEYFDGFAFDSDAIKGSKAHKFSYDDSTRVCDFRFSFSCSCSCSDEPRATSSEAEPRAASSEAEPRAASSEAEPGAAAPHSGEVTLTGHFTRADIFTEFVLPQVKLYLRAARFLCDTASGATQTCRAGDGSAGGAGADDAGAGDPSVSDADLEMCERFQAAGRALARPETAAGAHLAAIADLRVCTARPDDSRRYGAKAVLYLRDLCGHRDNEVRRAAVAALLSL